MRKLLQQWPAIVPIIILAIYGIIVKWLDNFYATDGRSLQYRAVIVLVIFTIIMPLICLSLEIVGLLRAIKAYKNLDEDEPYRMRRCKVHLVFLYFGEILLTLIWLVADIYIAIPVFA